MYFIWLQYNPCLCYKLINSVVLQILEVKSPMKQTKGDKNKNIDCDKVIIDINSTHLY